eukprot:201743-Chlamydomonas_euryale.AAC.4
MHAWQHACMRRCLQHPNFLGVGVGGGGGVRGGGGGSGVCGGGGDPTVQRDHFQIPACEAATAPPPRPAAAAARSRIPFGGAALIFKPCFKDSGAAGVGWGVRGGGRPMPACQRVWRHHRSFRGSRCNCDGITALSPALSPRTEVSVAVEVVVGARHLGLRGVGAGWSIGGAAAGNGMTVCHGTRHHIIPAEEPTCVTGAAAAGSAASTCMLMACFLRQKVARA